MPLYQTFFFLAFFSTRFTRYLGVVSNSDQGQSRQEEEKEEETIGNVWFEINERQSLAREVVGIIRGDFNKIPSSSK